MKLASGPHFTLNPDSPAARPDNPLHHRQTESRAFALFLGRKIGIEDPCQHFGGHPSARIGNREFQTFLGQYLVQIEIFFLLFDPGEFDIQATYLALHGMGGIGAEIHEDLMNPAGINLDRPQATRDFSLDRDGGRDGGPQQLQDFLDGGTDIDRTLARLVCPAEGEDLPDKITGPAAAFFHLFQILPDGIRTFVGEEAQISIADYS